MKSATVDLKLAIEPRGAAAAQGPVAAHLQGPFASQGAGKLPKFAFTAELQSGGQSFSAGATWTGTKGYVALEGTPYEVSGLVMQQFVAGYEQSLKSAQAPHRAGSCSAASASTSRSGCRTPRNEGAAQVGDADTIKISGAADVEQVIADLDKITERAASLNVPGASGKRPAAADAAAEAGRGRRDQGAHGHGLHGRRGPDPAPAGRQRRPQGRGLEDRRGAAAGRHLHQGRRRSRAIPRPQNPKPFGELLKAIDAAGIADSGSAWAAAAGDTTAPNSSETPNNVDKYAACIEQANGDGAKARKCADLLLSS